MLGIECTISSSPSSARAALLNKTYGYNGKNEATYIQTSWGRIDYKYNEQSLRVVKIPPTSTDKRWYVFSGTTLIGEVSSSGATLAYTHGADGLVSMRDVTTNTSRFFHYGAQGETRCLTNSSGTVTDSYYYEAYGNPVASSGSTYNPYRYGGKFGYYKDDGGESLLATWRWYSPSQMRWINRDPIKFDGGSNVYQYVEGNPVRYVDPSGLEPYTNKTKKPKRIKPEVGNAWPPVYCMPGKRCEADAYYEFDGESPAGVCTGGVKLPDNCEGEFTDSGVKHKCRWISTKDVEKKYPGTVPSPLKNKNFPIAPPLDSLGGQPKPFKPGAWPDESFNPYPKGDPRR